MRFSTQSLEESHLVSAAMLPNDYGNHVCKGLHSIPYGEFVPGEMITEFWQGIFTFDGALMYITGRFFNNPENPEEGIIEEYAGLYKPWQELLGKASKRSPLAYREGVHTLYNKTLQEWELLSEQEVLDLPWPQNIDFYERMSIIEQAK